MTAGGKFNLLHARDRFESLSNQILLQYLNRLLSPEMFSSKKEIFRNLGNKI